LKVFISYSRLDASETAKAIHNYLTEIGHQGFIDTSDIRGGDEWRNTIQNEISTCDIFVLIVTRSSLRREEVKSEVELAKNLKKRIIPCIAKKYVNYQDLQWDLNKYQGIMFERLDDLIQELDYMIDLEAKTKTNNSSSA
jgi:TIR domain